MSSQRETPNVANASRDTENNIILKTRLLKLKELHAGAKKIKTESLKERESGLKKTTEKAESIMNLTSTVNGATNTAPSGKSQKPTGNLKSSAKMTLSSPAPIPKENTTNGAEPAIDFKEPPPLTIRSLRNEMWEMVHKMKAGKVEAKTADSMVRACSGIMRSVKLELDVMNSFGKLNPKSAYEIIGIEQKAFPMPEGVES